MKHILRFWPHKGKKSTEPAMAERILLIEDDRELGSQIADYLSKAGYAMTWRTEGTYPVQSDFQGFSLLILDLMLPGVWGMDIFGHQMVEPSYKDFMGYCEPTWISDYVYENILDFMQATGGAQSFHIPEEDLDQEWERIAIGGTEASSARFLSPLKMKRPPTGASRTVSITRDDGTSAEVEGRFYAYDHLPGGVMFVKKQSNRIVALDAALEIGGMTRAIRAAR